MLIVSFVAMVALFVYAGRLAIRIPDESLARQTRTVMWGLIAASVLGLILAGLALVMAGQMAGGVPASGPARVPVSASAVPKAAFVMAPVGCVAGVLYLVFGIWSLLLLLRYRREFQACATQARLTWAASRPDEAGGMRNYPEVR